MLKKHKELFSAGIESKEFFCGEALFEPNFALVGSNDPKFVDQKVFFKRFVVSANLTCESTIETHYYSFSQVPLLCCQCGCDLSGLPEIIEKYKIKKERFSIVLPTCQSAKCGSFKCERKKKVKRPAPGASPQPQKRRRKGKKGGGK